MDEKGTQPKAMQEEQASVPYFVHEGMVDKLTRIIKWLVIALVATIAVGLIYAYMSNQAWMSYVEEIRAANPATAIEEVQNAGVHQLPDQDADR